MVQQDSISELVSRNMQGAAYETLGPVEGIGAKGTSAVIAIASMLRSDDRETRWRAAVALERIGSPAVEALVAAARDPDFRVRVPAMWALEHVGDSRAVGPLVENLMGGNECCRWMAAAALTRIGGKRELAAVEAAFANDPTGRGVVEELVEGS